MATEQQLSTADKQARVLLLAQAGYGFREIAQAVGYKGPSSAHYAFKAALGSVLRPAAQETLTLELGRLDAMQRAIWPLAQRGDLKAQQQVLRLMERRSAYLGLDAPTSIHAKVDIEPQLRAVAAELGLPPEEVLAEAERILVLTEKHRRSGWRR